MRHLHWLYVLALAAAAEGSDVRGWVAWDGPASNRAVVELGSHLQQGLYLRATIDGLGEFYFPKVPPGEYELRISHDRGIVLHREHISVRGDGTIINVRVNVRPVERPAGQTVSLAALYKPSAKARKEFEKGRQALAKQDVNRAVKHFAQACERDPQFAGAFANLGACYAMQNRDTEAIVQLKRALELDPALTVAYNNMGKVLLRLKRYHDAEQAAHAALRQEPSSETGHYLAGVSLEMQEEDEGEALEHLRRAASIPMARLYAADILARRGERKEAARELRAYLRVTPPEKRAEVEAIILRLEK